MEFAHISIPEAADGAATLWMEPVTYEEYHSADSRVCNTSAIGGNKNGESWSNGREASNARIPSRSPAKINHPRYSIRDGLSPLLDLVNLIPLLGDLLGFLFRSAIQPLGALIVALFHHYG